MGYIGHLNKAAHTPLNRAWDAVSLTGENPGLLTYRWPLQMAPDWTEGRKEKWAVRKAVTYMLAHTASPSSVQRLNSPTSGAWRGSSSLVG